MFGWGKKRGAYQLGRDTGTAITSEIEAHIAGRVIPAITSEIEAHIAGRVIPASDAVVEVFRGRLDTIFDEPEHDPRTVAKVEWDIFREHLGEFTGHMRAELNVRTYKWDDVINELDGMRGLIDEYITKRLDDIVSDMRLKAVGLIPAAVAEIERREAADAR